MNAFLPIFLGLVGIGAIFYVFKFLLTGKDPTMRSYHEKEEKN